MRGYPSVCLPTYPSIYLFASFCQQANCGAMSLQISAFHRIPSVRPLSTWNSGQDAMGTKKWIPGSRTFWNLPSRSMTHAICCGTTTTPTWKRGAETPTRREKTGQRNENNSTIMTCHIGFCIEISGRLPHYTAWKQGVWKNFESANWSLHGLEYFLPISKRQNHHVTETMKAHWFDSTANTARRSTCTAPKSTDAPMPILNSMYSRPRLFP